MKTVGPTAALAGIPAGIQAQGVWAGRRQLFIRFAGEAETATMYTADALANELARSAARSVFHSISIAGRDPLANCEYLCAAFDKAKTGLPVMLDTDGQRPEAVRDLKDILDLVQVTVDGTLANADSLLDRANESLRAAADASCDHALVIVADERLSDGIILRIVEQARAASERTSIILHPGPGIPVDRDRRWTMLAERASSVHPDVRMALRLPPQTGMR
jgi:organic radical activating enzyme